MIKQKHLASTLVRYFRQFTLVLFLSYLNVFHSALALEETKVGKTEKIDFPAAVIDMKVVLAKSSAFFKAFFAFFAILFASFSASLAFSNELKANLPASSVDSPIFI